MGCEARSSEPSRRDGLRPRHRLIGGRHDTDKAQRDSSAAATDDRPVWIAHIQEDPTDDEILEDTRRFEQCIVDDLVRAAERVKAARE